MTRDTERFTPRLLGLVACLAVAAFLVGSAQADPPSLSVDEEHSAPTQAPQGDTDTGEADDSAQSGAAPGYTFSDSIEVSRRLLEVRVVDGLGRPVEGLGPEDFRVKVAGQSVRVEAVDRVIAEAYDRRQIEASPSSQTDAARTTDGSALAFDPRIAEPTQLVVFFFQSDMKTPGLLRLHRHIDEMIDTMAPEVAAAVVSFDSHLKLRQDFTTDRAALRAAVERSFGAHPTPFPEPPADGGPTLTDSLTEDEARGAAFADDALALVSRSLADLPGEKALIYVGWGLGSFGRTGISVSGSYNDALEALIDARIAAFVLDTTGNFETHAQELSLRAFADYTGGQYFATYDFPSREVHRVVRTLEGGRYLLLVELPELHAGWHDLDVSMRDGWKFRRVLAPVRLPVPGGA